MSTAATTTTTTTTAERAARLLASRLFCHSGFIQAYTTHLKTQAASAFLPLTHRPYNDRLASKGGGRRGDESGETDVTAREHHPMLYGLRGIIDKSNLNQNLRVFLGRAVTRYLFSASSAARLQRLDPDTVLQHSVAWLESPDHLTSEDDGVLSAAPPPDTTYHPAIALHVAQLFKGPVMLDVLVLSKFWTTTTTTTAAAPHHGTRRPNDTFLCVFEDACMAIPFWCLEYDPELEGVLADMARIKKQLWRYQDEIPDAPQFTSSYTEFNFIRVLEELYMPDVYVLWYLHGIIRACAGSPTLVELCVHREWAYQVLQLAAVFLGMADSLMEGTKVVNPSWQSPASTASISVTSSTVMATSGGHANVLQTLISETDAWGLAFPWLIERRRVMDNDEQQQQQQFLLPERRVDFATVLADDETLVVDDELLLGNYHQRYAEFLQRIEYYILHAVEVHSAFVQSTLLQ
jgi:hypothetical protein